MRARNKLAAAFGASALMAAGLVGLTTTAATAVAPSGGCASFFRTGTPPIDSTTPAASYLGDPNGPWSDEASTSVDPDHTLTSSGGSLVGDTRNFALTYDKGMLSFAPADGDQYWYFSVNGQMLPAIVQTGVSLEGGVVSPGDTVSGSYTITDGGANEIVFEKMIFEATAGVRVVCSGQEGNTNTDNPHATPVATNVTNSFTAFAVASASITGITSQATLNNARFGDVISFEASDFSAAGTGTAEICTTAATPVCGGATTFAVAADGTGSGAITVPGSLFAPGAGEKVLRLSSGGEAGTTPIRIMGAPSITSNLAAGGAGSVVTVTGTNFDPGQPIQLYGSTGTGQTDPATTDAAVTVTAGPNGGFVQQYTVNDSATTTILALHAYRMPPGNSGSFVIPGYVDFSFSGDSCIAKVGLAATGNCELLQTVTLDVTAGDLTMSKEAGDVALSGVTLDGTPQTATGDLREVTVIDNRGGSLGWSLVGTFDGLSGPVAIPASALSWTPDCVGDSDDTVTSGGTAAFGGQALALCSVSTDDLGVNSVSDGNTRANAGLELSLPSGQAAGSYLGTLTLTLS